jgi:thiamine-phosphate pyrophosphorylase
VLLIDGMARNLAETLRLVLVTDDRLLSGRDPVGVCTAAVRGGVTAVELRLKHASPRELVSLARRLISVSAVPILINDRLDVALAAGAAGVHLGIDDLPVSVARRAAPEGFVIGASVGSDGEVENGLGADYWGIGPWRETGTKGDAGPSLGAGGFAGLAARSGDIPCVAIGGIRPEDVPDVIRAGGVGVAVASGVLRGPDVEENAWAYAVVFDSSRA